MPNPITPHFYNQIRGMRPSQAKKPRRISLPYVSILANHPDYAVRDAATGPVLKSCKPPKPSIG